ncbi:YibE/F family protein [Pseudonocardia aurantiaca]
MPADDHDGSPEADPPALWSEPGRRRPQRHAPDDRYGPPQNPPAQVRRHPDPWDTGPGSPRQGPPRGPDTGPHSAGPHSAGGQSRGGESRGGQSRGSQGAMPRPPRSRVFPPADGAPGRSVRRPGDRPGAPAELFVETTAETPALRRDEPLVDRRREQPARPEPEPEPDSDQRSGRRRRVKPKRTANAAAAGHGHGHGHSPAPPAGRRVRILIAALLVPCALAALVGLVVMWPSGGRPATADPVTQTPVRAEVTATRATGCNADASGTGCVAVIVHMSDGPRTGRDLVQVVPVEPGSPQFAVGDQVVLSWSGADPDDPGSYQIVDFQRGPPLIWLAVLFAGAVILLGRWRGLAALGALVLSFVVLLWFVVPAILAGHNPLAVAIVGSCLIMFAVLYLTHGLSARTSTAVIGTLLSLALIGALAAAFSAFAKLTGLDDQAANLIATLGTAVDARGLLLAGVVIGALGVLDDVTVTQTSAVWELHRADPELGTRGLFASAMRIGRDHVASAVNTLVLAYAGASLPLLLLFSLSGRSLGDVVTTQDVATEIVRTLVGSIGLVASVPITTAIAAVVASREKVSA